MTYSTIWCYTYNSESEVSIMPYIISDGERYVMKNFAGKYVTIRNEAMADKFDEETANNILNNCISKKNKEGLRVFKIKDEKEVNYNVEIADMVDNLEIIDKFISEISEKERKLTNEQSHVDKELSDVLHYCENYNLNACQGYKAYKMIKELRQKRRKIKNELEVTRFILDKHNCSNLHEEVEHLIEDINSRTYKPRIIKELFNV